MTHSRTRRQGLLRMLRWGAVLAAGGAHARAPALPDAAAPEPDPDPGLRRTVYTSDGVQLSVLECQPAGAATRDGPGADPGDRALTIVLLPGWCMPAAIWREQLLGLGERWRTLAIDPRGQGESQVPATGYTADRRADDVHDVLQSLAPNEPVVLVGWSLGVLEALQYVQRHGSSRLAAMALVDNSIGEPPAPSGNGNFLRELRRARVPTIEVFVRSMFAHPPPQTLVEKLRASALRMPLEASLALLNYPLPREHWRQLVHAFDRPLAYFVTPRYREQSEHLHLARPLAKVEIFEHAGHALFVDEALRFNRALADWIESLA